MRVSAGAAILVTLGMLASVDARAEGDAENVRIQAEHGEATGLDESSPVTFTATGDVKVTAGRLQLRAPKLELRQTPREAILEGGVIGLRGHTVLTAQRLVFDLDARSLILTDGQISMKGYVTADELNALFRSSRPEQVCHAGVEALTLRASRLSAPEGPTFYADDVFFTTCACPDGCRPMLSFTARSIAVTPGETASLTSPVFRLFSVPVFWLPWISIPLSDRKTGVLFPVANFAGPAGFDIGLPFYVTLGRSADMTLTPHYSFGTNNADNGGVGENSLASRGPGGDFELRWRPSDDAIGQLRVSYLYDTSLRFPSPSTETRGSRGAVTLLHRQELFGGNAAVGLDLVADARYLIDTAVALPRRNQNYLRSVAGYSVGLGRTGLSFETAYLQNLNPASAPDPNDGTKNITTYPRTRFTDLPGTVAPLGRLALGRNWGLGSAVMTGRLDVIQEGVYPGATLTDGHIRRFLGGGRLTQTMPLLAGQYGTVSFEASERAQFLSAGETPTPGWRAGGYLDLLAQSRLERTYESGWLHSIIPSLRLRAVGVLQQLGNDQSVPFSNGLYQVSRTDPTTVARVPRILQNELDMALPQFGTLQGVARVATNVSAPKRANVEFAVEYHSSLDTSTESTQLFNPGQLHAKSTVSYERWRLSVDGAYALGADRRPTTSGAAFSAPLPFGVSSISSFFRYFNGPTDDLISRGLDVLFTPPAESPAKPRSVNGANGPQISFGGGLNIAYQSWRFVGSAALTKNIGAIGASQDYRAVVAYETESCGRLSLTLQWNHQPGSTFNLPIPVPGFDFNGAQSAVAAGLGLASQDANH
jgi:LPS-assembly protein